MTAEGVPPESAAKILRLTAAIHREGDWYVARCLEVDAVSQGETVEHALANLREVVEIFLEEGEIQAQECEELTAFAPLDVRVPA